MKNEQENEKRGGNGWRCEGGKWVRGELRGLAVV